MVHHVISIVSYFFSWFVSYLGSYQAVLLVHCFACIFKLYLVHKLILIVKQSKGSWASLMLFILFAISAGMVDFMWVIKSIREFFPSLDYKLCLFLLRIAWGCVAIQYQALTLFINSLLGRHYKVKLFDLAFSVGSFGIFLFFVGLAFYQFNCPTPQERPLIELTMQKVGSIYVLLNLVFCAIMSSIKMIRTRYLPKILRDQLRLLLQFLIVPYIISEFIQVYPFDFAVTWVTNSLTVVVVTSILLTYMMYYCLRRVMGLRLFNTQARVDLRKPIVPTRNFQYVVEQLETLKSIAEIRYIVQNYLERAFIIPPEKIRFYVRNLDTFAHEQPVLSLVEGPVLSPSRAKSRGLVEGPVLSPSQAKSRGLVEGPLRGESEPARRSLGEGGDEAIVEGFIRNQATPLNQKILVTDELEFSNFYEEKEEYNIELALLYALNADIFLPIYENKMISAYIIIERDARKEYAPLYSGLEQDQMQVLAGVLSNAITLLVRNELRKLEREIKQLNQENNELRHESQSCVLEQEKQQEKYEEQLEREYQENKTIRDELSRRLHEIDQYREGVSHFIFHGQQEREFGIIFYKTPHFKFGNPPAQKLLSGIDLNKHAGHGITKTLNELVTRVLDYRVPQHVIAKNDQGHTLAFTAISNIEHDNAKNHAIIIVSRPEVSDFITQKLTSLRDLSHWDYLFYLESTKTGGLVNDLIPGSGTTFLNFKIDLLKMAFSKKALMLMAAPDDVVPMAELIHDISLRAGSLQRLILKEPEKGATTAVKLFGTTALLDLSAGAHTMKAHEHVQEVSIFERFRDRSGTILIENIQHLSIPTQDALAAYLKTGRYCPVASQERKSCLARIVCTAPANLPQLVEEKKFSKALFQELEPTTLVVPSLLTLPEEEFCELACDLSHQAIKDPAFKQALELTERDTKKMLEARPASIAELRKKVQHLLHAKVSKQDFADEVTFDPAFDADPELMHAARLGPDAVKDAQILAKLLKKFNGNENQVAIFLGVNRSTVNRRVKEFGLGKSMQFNPE
jgi:sigma-54-interacting transcriptional regulator